MSSVLAHEYDPASDTLPKFMKLIRRSYIKSVVATERFNRVCAERGLPAA